MIQSIENTKSAEGAKLIRGIAQVEHEALGFENFL